MAQPPRTHRARAAWIVLGVVVSIVYPPLCIAVASVAAWRSSGRMRVFFIIVAVLALLFSLQTGYLFGHSSHGDSHGVAPGQ